MKYSDLNGKSKEELYKQAKAMRDLLFKRKKRLEEALQKDPTELSTAGLYHLTGDPADPKVSGIPMVSTGMSLNELKVATLSLDRLKNMKTATVTGARKHMEDLARTAAGAPKKGRLTKDEKDKVDRHKLLVSSLTTETDRLGKVSASGTYWRGFNYFKDQQIHNYADSNEALRAYEEFLWDTDTGVDRDIQQIREGIDDLSASMYAEDEENAEEIEKAEDSAGLRPILGNAKAIINGVDEDVADIFRKRNK